MINQVSRRSSRSLLIAAHLNCCFLFSLNGRMGSMKESHFRDCCLALMEGDPMKIHSCSI